MLLLANYHPSVSDDFRLSSPYCTFKPPAFVFSYLMAASSACPPPDSNLSAYSFYQVNDVQPFRFIATSYLFTHFLACRGLLLPLPNQNVHPLSPFHSLIFICRRVDEDNFIVDESLLISYHEKATEAFGTGSCYSKTSL